MPSKPLRFVMFDELFFVQCSIIAYFTSFCVIFLQGHQFDIVKIGFADIIVLIPFLLKIILSNQIKRNTIITTMAGTSMLTDISDKNKFEQQGLAL